MASDGNYYIVGDYALSAKDVRKKMTDKLVTNEETGMKYSIQYVPECVYSTKQFADKNAQKLDSEAIY